MNASTTFNKNMRSALGVASVLFLAGCAGPNIDVDLASAKETFKQRQLSNSNAADSPTDTKAEAVPAAPVVRATTEGERRRLVQFKYGEKSLSDPVFAAFLKNHADNFSGDQARRTESWSVEERSARRRLLVLDEMKMLRNDLQSYGAPVRIAADQLPATELNYRGAPVTTVFTSLAEKAEVPIRFSEAIRRGNLRISGTFFGDPIEVMDQLARQNRLAVRAEHSGGMFHLFTVAELDQNPALATGLNDPFSSIALSNAEYQVVSHYRYVVSLLEAGDEINFRRQMDAIRPPQVGISATHAYESLSRGAIRLFGLLRQFDQGTLGEHDHPSMTTVGARGSARSGGISHSILSLGKFESGLCAGSEEATEKVAILYELPANVKTFVENYFKSGAAGVGGAPAAAAARTPAQAPSPAQSTGSAQPALAQASPPATQAAGPTQSSTSAQLAPAQEQASAGCTSRRAGLRVLDDPTGVVLTGSPYDLDLAFRLIRDRDIPSRQVLSEVFLVEVQKDWERVIEASLRGNSANAGAVTNVFSALTDTSPGTRGAQLKPNMGTRDIVAFINLLESNAVGRNISSPTIIARDGEKADLEKKVTLRKVLNKTVQNNSGGSTVIESGQIIEELDVPLKLSITPRVNRHNNHVVFLFEYDETILTGEVTVNPLERGTTQNKIKTNVETAPGDVVILAGLFKESNNRANSAIPGFSEAGILTPLLGGSHNRSTSSSELLVFIKPTVIEPKAYTAQVNSLR